jgi:hypothetical protein
MRFTPASYRFLPDLSAMSVLIAGLAARVDLTGSAVVWDC